MSIYEKGKDRYPLNSLIMEEKSWVHFDAVKPNRKYHFVYSLSGFQLMWQIGLYLPDQPGKASTRIRYQTFNGIVWIQLYCTCTCKMWFFKAQCIASSPEGLPIFMVVLEKKLLECFGIPYMDMTVSLNFESGLF